MKLSETLSVALLQSDIAWGDREFNFYQHKGLMKKTTKDVDIVLFPETFSTGFMETPEKISEKDTDILLAEMQSMSVGNDCAVCGSGIISENGKLYNRFYFVDCEANIFHYDKRHLFKFGGENELFTQGNKRIIINYCGWNILLQVCYDLRFPVWQRNVWSETDGYEYDLMLICANWPTSRIEVWKTLLRARAIENQCYVAGVNRVGTDGKGIDYNGYSTIVDFKGNIIAQGKENQIDIIEAVLDKIKLTQFRKAFQAGEAQDRFELF